MRRPAAAVILIISLFACCSDNRGTIEDANKAYDSGDYQTAYRLYKPLAERGDARAQFNRYTGCAETVCGASGVAPLYPDGQIYEVVSTPRTIGLRFAQDF